MFSDYDLPGPFSEIARPQGEMKNTTETVEIPIPPVSRSFTSVTADDSEEIDGAVSGMSAELPDYDASGNHTEWLVARRALNKCVVVFVAADASFCSISAPSEGDEDDAFAGQPNQADDRVRSLPNYKGHPEVLLRQEEDKTVSLHPGGEGGMWVGVTVEEDDENDGMGNDLQSIEQNGKVGQAEGEASSMTPNSPKLEIKRYPRSACSFLPSSLGPCLSMTWIFLDS